MSVLTRFLRDLMESGENRNAGLYLQLLKKCVSNHIYDDDLDLLAGPYEVDPATGKYFTANPAPADQAKKYYGNVWPSRAHTMVGIPRLDNIQYCVEAVLEAGIPGDLIETGVWRGGAVIFMRGVLKAHGVTDRLVWAADSFEGLPQRVGAVDAPGSEPDFHQMRDLSVSLEEVRENFRRYDLLDDQVRFLKGWFRDSLPTAPLTTLAVLRLDGDMYDSTMDALVNLYPKLSPGGFVIVDDYNAVHECNRAVDTFRRDRGIASGLSLIPGFGAFWRK